MPLTRTHIRTRAARLALLALASLLPCVPAAGAADDSVGFGVAPMRFDVDVSPGQSTTRQITITNTDKVDVVFTFRKVDIQGDKKDPNATPVLLAGKFDSAISAYDWLDVSGPLTVPAGESRTADVKVTAPAGATGGHYAAVVVNAPEKGIGNIRASSAWAVPFLINAGGVPPPDIKITETKKVGPGTTVTEYYNTGNVATKPVAELVGRDPVTRREVRRVQGECTTALPRSAGQCVFDTGAPGTTVGGSGGLRFGEKEYVEVGDPGTERGDRARGELPTEWAGTWTSLLLPLVGIALFIMYFLFLRRRRKDEEDEDQLVAGGA